MSIHSETIGTVQEKHFKVDFDEVHVKRCFIIRKKDLKKPTLTGLWYFAIAGNL